jgi:hypothetical protein
MKQNHYQNPEDPLHTVCQFAWNTDQGQFEIIASRPTELRYFNDLMAYRRTASLSWLSVYPLLDQIAGWDSTKAIFVDIGGNIGHQCAHFKAKYSQVPGRVINQDLLQSIENALTTPGVENMVHDYFDPQPIRGMIIIVILL